jgi:hypothetical protein
MSFERRPGAATRTEAEMTEREPAAIVGKRSLAEAEPAAALAQSPQVDGRELAREMVGKLFLLKEPQAGLPQGAVVVVRDWRVDRDDVLVHEEGDAQEQPTVVKKTSLVAKQANVAGITPYLANPAIEKNVNDRLVRETQYNRFDPIIKKEVDAANAKYQFPDALDPNLVKSMLFEESRMGTSGMHLIDEGSGVKTRFNVGQVIDSHGEALLRLIQNEHPKIYETYQLADLDAALKKANFGMSKEDYQQFAAIKPSGIQLGEYFIRTWSRDVPPLQRPNVTSQFELARKELFKSPDPAKEPDRNNTYEFWIHAMVEWLVVKRKMTKSWAEAARAYNGSGAAAENYKTRVTSRATSANTARAENQAVMPFEKDGAVEQKPIDQPARDDAKPPSSPSVTAPTPAPPETAIALNQVPHARVAPGPRIERLDNIYFTGVVVPATAAAFVVCDVNGYVWHRHTTQPARENGVIHHEPEAFYFTLAAGQYFIFAAYWGIEPDGAKSGTPRKIEHQYVGPLDVLAGDMEWRNRDRRL